MFLNVGPYVLVPRDDPWSEIASFPSITKKLSESSEVHRPPTTPTLSVDCQMFI